MIRSAPLVALLAVVAVLLVGCPSAEQEEAAQPETIVVTATPVPAEVAEEPEPDEPSPTPTPEPSPSPTPVEAREPTDGDRARFIASYDPGGVSGGQQVAADIDGDGTREVVFAWVVDAERRSRVDIAAWTGTSYEIVARELGGPAERLEDVRVSDLTDDGMVEVLTVQSVGSHALSATLWRGRDGGTLEPLRGVGDCFDGSHTYGDSDVRVADDTGDGRAEVRAVCEDDRPRDLWPTVVYEWEDGAYRCSHRREADGSRTDCA